MKKTDKSIAKHYFWKDICEGWHFVERDDLSVIVEKMPPNTSEDMHYHCKARQFFYILSGGATMRFERGDQILDAGMGIEIDPMEAHQMMNTSDEEISFIVVSTPKSHGDKILKSK